MVITTLKRNSRKPELRFGDVQWRESLTMVPAESKAKGLSQVNQSAQTDHHCHHYHHHHQIFDKF